MSLLLRGRGLIALVAIGLGSLACRSATEAGDPAPGTLVWRYAEPRGSANAPYADTGLVAFSLFLEPVAVALDARTGALRWRTPLPMTLDNGPWPPADGSPIAWQDLVFFPTWDLFALDRSTGAIRWSLAPPDDFPAAGKILLHQGRLYTAGRKFYAVDPTTGTVLWSRALGDRAANPIALGATVFVTSGTFVPGTNILGPGHVYALDAGSGATLWEAAVDPTPPDRQSFPYGPTAVSGDLLIVGTADGRIMAFGTADGSLRWSYNTSSPVRKNVPRGGVTILGDLVLTGGSTGILEALEIASGTRRWAVQMEGSILNPITTDGTVAYVAQGWVDAFDRTGRHLWRHTADYISSATPANGNIHLGGERALYAVRAGGAPTP